MSSGPASCTPVYLSVCQMGSFQPTTACLSFQSRAPAVTLSHISGLVCLWGGGPVCQALGTGGSLSATGRGFCQLGKKKYGEYLRS